MNDKPLIVQTNKTLLLQVDHPLFEEVRAKLGWFAELEKSPEYLHTYRITSLSLWNAASSKLTAETIIDVLYQYSKYPVPQSINAEITKQIDRFGKLELFRDDNDNLILHSKEKEYIKEILKNRKLQEFFDTPKDEYGIYIKPQYRGQLKQVLIHIGFPVRDIAGYEKGKNFKFGLKEPSNNSTKSFVIRDYQEEAIDTFYQGGSVEGGSGVVVLPCGAGKTIVGIGVMYAIQTETLILVTNTLSIRQWKEEILDKTNIPESDIGEYSGEKKEIRPVTLATYHIITHRRSKVDYFTHFHLFSAKKWGLVIYDEVHLLPAPVFRMTSELQAKRRLGLTATLVREDGLEQDVFSLIGPKKIDLPWKRLEKEQWIAKVFCHDIRVPMRSLLKNSYVLVNDRIKFRMASENPEKIRVVGALIRKYKGEQMLIIGQYLNQLHKIAKKFNLPLITGKTSTEERANLYHDFRERKIQSLVVSKVANFSIDLPDASVAIQLSGTFGSRQEETQRVGRILRPKKRNNNSALFYSLVTEDSAEEKFSHNRQLFLTEQGYSYTIYSYKKFQAEFSDYLVIKPLSSKQQHNPT